MVYVFHSSGPNELFQFWHFAYGDNFSSVH